jgi:hypothetical protein
MCECCFAWLLGVHCIHCDGSCIPSCCVVCGEPIDYCQGHGDIGDPDGARILAQHDDDNHVDCHPNGCDDAPMPFTPAEHVASLMGDDVSEWTV